MSVRILLAEDHARLRIAIADLLVSAGFEVAGAARDGAELLRLARELRPDVVVADISMPGMNGITVASLIREELRIPTVVLSSHCEAEYILEALSQGVQGYVLKSSAATCLVDAVNSVARGEQHLGRTIKAILAPATHGTRHIPPMTDGALIMTQQIEARI